jgi:hypothetical protein
MNNEMAMYILSGLVLALGGVSLFVQKVYTVDQESGAKIEMELPLLGKMKTNYPALGFAFLGVGLAIFTFSKTCEIRDQWVISGHFKAPEARTIEWSKGVLTLYPKQFNHSIKPDGSFLIELSLLRSRKFEDVVGQISYYNWSGNAYAEIMVNEEYQKYKRGAPTVLEAAEGRTRRYGPVEVRVVQKATQ